MINDAGKDEVKSEGKTVTANPCHPQQNLGIATETEN
jgi:hypothetical protein